MPLPPWTYKFHAVGRRVHGHAVGPVANRDATAAGAHVLMGSVVGERRARVLEGIEGQSHAALRLSMASQSNFLPSSTHFLVSEGPESLKALKARVCRHEECDGTVDADICLE